MSLQKIISAYFVTLNLPPLLGSNVEGKCLAGDGELSRVASCTTEHDRLAFCDEGDCMTEPRLRQIADCLYLLHRNLRGTSLLYF